MSIAQMTIRKSPIEVKAEIEKQTEGVLKMLDGIGLEQKQ
jgi:hypothetical protein